MTSTTEIQCGSLGRIVHPPMCEPEERVKGFAYEEGA